MFACHIKNDAKRHGFTFLTNASFEEKSMDPNQTV